MKIALACGGTGGHIFPGLATADALVKRGHQVTLWLAGKDVESAAIQGWEGPVVIVRAEGFESNAPLKAFMTLVKLLKASRECRRVMGLDPPDAVLAMGSYASVGPLRAAMRLKIPYVLHESNVLPGRANKLFSRWAKAVAGCFEETRYYLKRKDLVLTGMPLRKELEAAAREWSSRTKQGEPFTILVMGGSRGSRALNNMVPEAIREIHKQGNSIRVCHLTGRDDEERVRTYYDEAGMDSRVQAFSQDMASLYMTSNLAICRSGAASCAELSAFGLPALLVPYPHATHDHQMANARAMERVGAADVVPERDLTSSWLVDYVVQCMREPMRLEKQSASSRARAAHSGALLLADLVEKTARGSRA